MSIDAPSANTAPATLQTQVHAMIQAIGGYWRPVNAVARLLEELAGLGEQLVTANSDREDLFGELRSTGAPGVRAALIDEKLWR